MHSLNASEVWFAKPDARIFHAAAGKVGVASGDVLMGVDAALDVLGTLGVGMQTVWVNREARTWRHAEQLHHAVADLNELVALLV